MADTRRMDDGANVREAWAAVFLAANRGGAVEWEEGKWPDAWLVQQDGSRVPVEVVTAFDRPAEEDPRTGASSAAELRHAEREAARRSRLDGEPWIAGAHVVSPDRAKGWVMNLNRGTAPPQGIPVDPPHAISTAIAQKVLKRYDPTAGTILVVTWYWTSIYHLFEDPDEWDLRRVDTAPLEQSTIREAWFAVVHPATRRARVERLYPLP